MFLSGHLNVCKTIKLCNTDKDSNPSIIEQLKMIKHPTIIATIVKYHPSALGGIPMYSIEACIYLF